MRRRISSAAFLSLAAAFVLAFSGCERERPVLDIDTPDGSVEVNETPDGIEIDVEDRS